MNSLDLSLRQRKLLHMMQNLSAYTTGAELARQLKVSPRTIRSDVVTINQALAPYHAQILSERSKGYLFSAEDPEAIQKMNQIDTAFFTKEDRVRYLAFQLCLSDIPINLFDLEDEMYVSHTTLEHDLHTLKREYSLSSPYINLTRNGDYLEYEKNEKKRRAILNRLFYEDWNYNTSGNAYYNYGFIDADILAVIMREIPIHLNRYHIQLEDPALVSLNLSIAIMYHRLTSGYPLPPSDPIAKPDTAALSACQDIFTSLEQNFLCSFPSQEKDEIYLTIASAHLMDASKLNFETVPHYFGPITIEMADSYLKKIVDTFGIDFSNDEDFYITLLQYIRYLQTPVHIFNSQGNHDISKGNLLVEYEIAFLFQSIALSHLGYYLNQTELIYLAHCISGALEYLYHNHPESKLRTVIACHMNLPATWALKRKVLGAFDNYIHITALLPVNAKSAYDFSDTDLVLTTVKKQITNEPATDTIQISPIMAPTDYRNLEDYIQKKRFQKLCPKAFYSLNDLLKNAFFHEAITNEDPFTILELLAGDFVKANLTEEKYLEDILRRESISSYSFQPGILFVHSLIPSSETKLSVATLEHRIIWNTHKIRLIVMAAFHPKDVPLLFRLQDTFCNTTYQREDLKKLQTQDQVIQFFS